MKLSKFNIVKLENEITPETFIVIIGLIIWTPDYPFGLQNCMTYNDKTYIISLIQGTYKNIVTHSKELLSDKEIQNKFKGMNLLLAGQIGSRMEILAYRNMQSLIEENLVYSHPTRIDFEPDDDALIYAIKNKVKMIHPSIN